MNKTLLNQKYLLALVYSTALIILCLSVTTKAKNIAFTEVTITSPYTLTQDIIVADVLPSKGKELVTFSIDEQGNRWLIIYHLDLDNNAYNLAEKTVIPSQFYRFDLSKRKEGKLKNLYFLSANSLVVYQNKQFKTLTSIDSLNVQEQAEFLSRGDFIQNLNDDVFDDVIIADFQKTHVLIGQGLNSFAKQTLPIKPSVTALKDGATYIQKQLYFADVNFDNQADILLIGDGEMIFYPQQANSQFSKNAMKVSINKKITAIDWWKKRDESGEPLDQSNLAYRKLDELRDVNADGITDMVVRYTKASGVLERVNDYEIFLGKNNNRILNYAETADSVIHVDGTLRGLKFVDIDNDDKLEVLLAGFDIGLSQIIGALVSGAIDQDVYVFKMDKQDKFTSKPAIRKDVELTFSLTSGQSGSGVVELADLNGDGLKELVLSHDDKELKIYLGKKPGKDNKSFEKRGVYYDIELPKDGKRVKVEDLNGDGKEDLLVRFSRLDGADKEKEVKILFSK